jgi:hypothetical protein
MVRHLAIKPFDELRRGHRIEFDAMGLQPLRATLVANSFLMDEVDRLTKEVSVGFARGEDFARAES